MQQAFQVLVNFNKGAETGKLGHFTVDHIAGLLALLCLRQSTKGDNAKPLEIYHPATDRSIKIMKRTFTWGGAHWIDDQNKRPIIGVVDVELLASMYPLKAA